MAARHLKANTQETGVGRKGKFALFRRLATWGEGGLASKNQIPVAVRWRVGGGGEERLKGSFRSVQAEGGGYEQNSSQL